MTKLNNYEFTFTGKRLGAIGLSEKFYSVGVIAETEEKARIKLYNAFDHIMVEKVVNRTETDRYCLGGYQCETDPRYFMSICTNGGNLWDSKTCNAVAPNETENGAELHKELINKLKELKVKGF